MKHDSKGMSRRDLLRDAGIIASGLAATQIFPKWAFAKQPTPPAPPDPVEQLRVEMGRIPIERIKLADNITMLSGPGGNVVVLHGVDGKIVVDSFVQPVFPTIKRMLDSMDSAPIKLLIDTHWHFDHTDNNANFHRAGAAILAHENTRKRLSETHDVIGLHFKPAAPVALPTETFKTTHKLEANGESINLGYFPPAHTDSDIYVHYTSANVLHLGDIFFNGAYPLIDLGTGGNINGTIAGAELGLKMADSRTKIVPGHGPLGDKAALTNYRDVLVVVRDRVKKLKASGKSLKDVVATKPTAEYDATWGKGLITPDTFVTYVYNTL